MARLTEHSFDDAVARDTLPSRRAPRTGLRGGPGRKYTLAERLAARTIRGPGCWIVGGYQLPNGYVQVSLRSSGGTAVLAHRLAYELAHGPIPEGLVVMHSCDTPNCVNPAHLSVGTQAQNIHDSIQKGRYNAFGRQKLNADHVREIRALWAAGKLRQRDIAARFGIARNTVSGIVHGKSWEHVGPFVPGVVLDHDHDPELVLERVLTPHAEQCLTETA
jgi:hypothetical protein